MGMEGLLGSEGGVHGKYGSGLWDMGGSLGNGGRNWGCRGGLGMGGFPWKMGGVLWMIRGVLGKYIGGPLGDGGEGRWRGLTAAPPLQC